MEARREQMFWDKVDKSGGAEACWEWTAVKNSWGYGRFAQPISTYKQRWTVAHRISWELAGNEIPEGMILCHRCDNPGCVNPAHLFLGTHKINAEDRESKGRGNQPRGERNCKAKLTAQQVMDIRANRALCRVTNAELAERFGVSKNTVQRIVAGTTWSHV